MTQTVIPWNDPKAVKKWSAALFVETAKKSYFTRKFIGEGENNVIQRKTELDQGPGDRISFDLSAKLRGRPVTGDNRAKGTEENLRFFTDEVAIDQVRHPVSAGGRMTRKRTMHDLRSIARERLSTYWAQWHDELVMMYLAGARGANEDYLEGTTYAGHAGNPLQAPDSLHLMYGGDAISKATLDASDVLGVDTIERADTAVRMMQSQNPQISNMQPVTVDGENRFVLLMSPFQEHDLRRSAGSNGWLDIQKAAAAAEGRNNPIFKGGLGMVKGTVLHAHESVIRFKDYGAGGNVEAARALLMGRQAAVIAYGGTGGMRLSWQEEADDYGNELTVNAGMIVGMKKARFNGADFGVMAIDTAAKNPR